MNAKAVCIKCWDTHAVVKLHLDGSQDLECDTCQETFSCDDVREIMEYMKSWERLIPLIEAFPLDDAHKPDAE